jgi:hypothetical protein
MSCVFWFRTTATILGLFYPEDEGNRILQTLDTDHNSQNSIREVGGGGMGVVRGARDCVAIVGTRGMLLVGVTPFY